MPTDFLEKVSEAVKVIDRREIENALVRIGIKSVNRVYVVGNGGSSALASHFVNDLNKFTKIKAFCLSDNIPTLTAIGNDVGYDSIFSIQVERFIEFNDVLIAISSSGNSPNILKAVEKAKGKGCDIVALTGFDGGKLKELADACIHIPTKKGEYELVESVHGAVLHYLILCLKK